MIYVGIDDTDMPNTPGTNQLAKALAAELAAEWPCRLIVRHQLLQDARVPFTSKNSSAALLLEDRKDTSLDELIASLRDVVRERAVDGSDAGLCVARYVPQAIGAYGRRCQAELVTQQEAYDLASCWNIHLEGLGGTNDGVIGALAAVGLVAGGNDGRVVQIGDWPDDLSGSQAISVLQERHVRVRCLDSDSSVESGTIDVGKHLRPNYREGRIVLFARRAASQGKESDAWEAVRLT